MIGAIQTAIATMATVVADLATHTASWTSALATKLNTNVDATVSSRASATNLATVDTVVDAIKAVTDTLPSAMNGRVALNVYNGTCTKGTGQDAVYYDFTVSAITDFQNVICIASGFFTTTASITSFDAKIYSCRMTSTTNVRVSHWYGSPSTVYFSGNILVHKFH